MLCECGFSLSVSQNIIMYSPFFLWWCEMIQCLCDEMKWGGVFHLIFLDQDWAWVTEPSGSGTSCAGRDYCILCSPPTTDLLQLRARLFPISTSALHRLTKSVLAQEPVLGFSFLIETYPDYLPEIKNSHTLVLAVHSYFSYSSFPSTLLYLDHPGFFFFCCCSQFNCLVTDWSQLSFFNSFLISFATAVVLNIFSYSIETPVIPCSRFLFSKWYCSQLHLEGFRVR